MLIFSAIYAEIVGFRKFSPIWSDMWGFVRFLLLYNPLPQQISTSPLSCQ
nr:MAG TPA: hypothetical protein [Caudoviricetes sp.]